MNRRHSPAATLLAVVTPLLAAAILGAILLAVPGHAAPEQTQRLTPAAPQPAAVERSQDKTEPAPVAEAPRRPVRVIYVGPITAR